MMKNILMKKTILIILAVMTVILMCACGNGGSAVSGSNDKEKEKDKGEWIARVQLYEFAWQYIDTKGNVIIDLTDYSLESVGAFHHGLAVIKHNDGYCDYINTKGEVVIDTYYLDAGAFGDNGLARVKSDENGLYGYINTKGKEVIPCQYKEATTFGSNGLAAVQDPETELYGYINEKGEEVIPFQYSEVNDFGDRDLAFVRPEDDGSMPLLGGYINGEGETVIPFEYVMGDYFENGIAVVQRFTENGDLRYQLIDEKGEAITDLKYGYIGSFSEGLAPAREGEDVYEGRWRYIDQKGNEVFEVDSNWYDEYPCVNGLVCVCENTTEKFAYGFANTKGEDVIPRKYPRVPEGCGFYGGLAPVSDYKYDDDGGFYYIDQNGERAFDGEYFKAGNFMKMEL